MRSTESVAAAMGAGKYAKALEDTCIQYDIVTALQKAHFLAQVAHESDGFRTAEEYASGAAYEGRLDLGNTQPGDGRRFKGRGLIQLTGRSNYTAFSQAILASDEFVQVPTHVAELPWAALVAGWFWQANGLNHLADRDDVVAVTRRINGGRNGLADRTRRLGQAKTAVRPGRCRLSVPRRYTSPAGRDGPRVRRTVRVTGNAMSSDITTLLQQWRAGEAEARDSLFDTVYETLHEMAMARLRTVQGDLTLRPTSLVHEALLRMLGRDVEFADRSHFFALAALKMRAVLVDHCRAQVAAKRGGGAINLTLSAVDLDMADGGATCDYDVLSLHQAMERLAVHDQRASRAVEMVYFGGMSHEEIATVLAVSIPTVERDLRFARAWLNRQLA